MIEIDINDFEKGEKRIRVKASTKRKAHMRTIRGSRKSPEAVPMTRENLVSTQSAKEFGIEDTMHASYIDICTFKDGSKGVYKLVTEKEVEGEVNYYKVNKILGWDTCPETVAVDLGKGVRSCQRWITNNKLVYTKDTTDGVKVERRHLNQLSKIFVQDMICGSRDRHNYNVLVKDDTFYAIDNDTVAEPVRNSYIKTLDHIISGSDTRNNAMLSWMEESDLSLDDYKLFKKYVLQDLNTMIEHKEKISELYNDREIIIDNFKFMEKYTKDQIERVVAKLSEMGLLKSETPDELLKGAGTDPKKLSSGRLKAVFTKLNKKGLLKGKSGDKKSTDTKSTSKEPEGAQGSSRQGLVKKKVTVHRDGKTFDQERWVKAGEDTPTDKPKKSEGDNEATQKEVPSKPKGPAIVGLNKPESAGEPGAKQGAKQETAPEVESKPEAKPETKPKAEEPTHKVEKFTMSKDSLVKRLDAMEAGLPDSVHDFALSLCEFKDGNKAIYKPATEEGDELDIMGETSYYNLTTRLGWNVCPQTEEVDLGDGNGSCQAFVKGKHAKISMDDDGAFVTEENFNDLAQIFAMDLVVGNGDRHNENIIIDENSKVWAIDNDTWVANTFVYNDESFGDSIDALNDEGGHNVMLDWMGQSLEPNQLEEFKSVVNTKLGELLKNEDLIKNYYPIEADSTRKGALDLNIKKAKEYLEAQK